MWVDERDKSVPGTFPEYGAIFMANRATMKECFKHNLFGLSIRQANFVKQIKSGMILFLFEFERRELHGVFQACSDGAMNIVPHAFTSTGKQFSAQVQVTQIWACSPLSEDEFYHTIRENYFSTKKFYFGLSENQVHGLLSLFSSRKLREERPPKQISVGYSERATLPVDDAKYDPNVEGRGRSVFPSGSENLFDNTLMGEGRFGNSASVEKMYGERNYSDIINENDVYADYVKTIDAYFDEKSRNSARSTSRHSVDPPYGIDSTACRPLDPQISNNSYPTATHAFGTTSLHYDPDAPGFDSGSVSRSRLNDEGYLDQDLKYRTVGTYLDQEIAHFSGDPYSEFMTQKNPEDEGYRGPSAFPLECDMNNPIKKDEAFYSEGPDNRLPSFEFDISRNILDFETLQPEKDQGFEGHKFRKQSFGSSTQTHRRDFRRNVLSNAEGACKKKRGSVFSRLASAPEVCLQKTGPALSRDEGNMVTSVDEIMNSLQKSHYNWVKMGKSKPAISQNANAVGPSKIKRKKETSNVIPHVEEIEKALVEEAPFLDFKRRSKMRRTSNDGFSENEISAVELPKKRKLIRPTFVKDEQNVQVASFVVPDNSKRREALREAWGLVNEDSKPVELLLQVAPDNEKVDTTSSSKCSNEEADNILVSVSNVIRNGEDLPGHVSEQPVLSSGNNCLVMGGSPKDLNYTSCLDSQDTFKASEVNFENDEGREEKLQGNSAGERFYEEMKCNEGNNQGFRRTGNDGVHREIEMKTAVDKSINLSSKQCPEPVGTFSDFVGNENRNQQQLNFISDSNFSEASAKTISNHNMQQTTQALHDDKSAVGIKESKDQENDFQKH